MYSSARVCRLAVRWLAICITMLLIHCPGDGHLGDSARGRHQPAVSVWWRREGMKEVWLGLQGQEIT